MSYVAYGSVASQESLGALIKKYAGEQACYFLRWSHRVSGMVRKLPESFEQAAGQVFNASIELRWKRQGAQSYEVLLLSQDDQRVCEEGLVRMAGDWETQVQKVLMHDYKRQNPQYPKPFVYEVDSQHIRQCYFRDRRSGIVHFVALVLSDNRS
ncbi:hypothetical protein ACN4EG_17105 [Alkalinema pantanalense CENA528]|uniref:hypothetical protein n=1 Tax=Alkalinema pantanalense TaxID=1620705 RepID=UPI003D6EB200